MSTKGLRALAKSRDEYRGKGARCAYPGCGKTGEHLIPIPGVILFTCQDHLELGVFITLIIEASKK